MSELENSGGEINGQFIQNILTLLNPASESWASVGLKWNTATVLAVVADLFKGWPASSQAQMINAVTTAISLPQPTQEEVARQFRNIVFYMRQATSSAEHMAQGKSAKGHDRTTEYMERAGESFNSLYALIPVIAGDLLTLGNNLGMVHS